MYEQILYALLGAVAYGVFGYLKTTPLDTWDWKKFSSTVAIGLMLGILEVYLKVDYDAAVLVATNAGLVVMVENVIKAIWRRLEAKPQ